MIRTLLDIALWRRTPRDLPASGSALAGVVALYVGLLTLEQLLATGAAVNAAPAAGATVLATCALVAVVLGLAGRLYRLPQTLLALFGTQCLLEPLALVLTALHPPAHSALEAFDFLAVLVLFVWSLLVIAHILRSALETPLAVGMLLAIASSVLSIAITNYWLAPAGAAPGA